MGLPLLGAAASAIGRKKGVKVLRNAMAGAGKKMRAAVKTVDKIQDSKKFQNISAAKEKIDQQRQMAEQQKQQQQQRVSEMARAKASTGDGAFGKAWMALKGETFHPSIYAHLEERSPKRAIAQIAPRPSPFPNQPDEPVNIEANRGPPDVDRQGFTSLPQQQSDRLREGDMPVGKPKEVAVGGVKPTLGNVNEEMFFNRGHLKIREGGRLQEDEAAEAREIMLEYARELVGQNGRYIPGGPTAISVITHQLDEIREAPDGSTGDTIVGTIRPHDDDPGQPQLHTVMFRGSHQPMDHAWKRRFDVDKVYDHSDKTRKKREDKDKDKDKKKKSVDSIAYFNDVLVKDRKTPEAMRHKREYDAAYNKRPDQVKYREELNRERRKRGIYGSHDHMDVSHTQGGKLTLEPEHSNRARHFKDKGTLRVVKSMKDDLELLRNLMQGPMDEQDKKIAEATIAMIEEREEEEDEEDKKLSRPLFGGSHMFL